MDAPIIAPVLVGVQAAKNRASPGVKWRYGVIIPVAEVESSMSMSTDDCVCAKTTGRMKRMAAKFMVDVKVITQVTVRCAAQKGISRV